MIPAGRPRLRWATLAWGGPLAALATLLLATGAEAHAQVSASDPGAGSSLGAAPAAVTITFTEAPDLRLSSIRVLDAEGHAVQRGGVQGVPGNRRQLRVPLDALPSGVYTVSWRAVSLVDGHATGGAFSFGIGVPADDFEVGAGATGASPATPSPEPIGVGGRWLFYAGAGLLLGAAWISLLAFRPPTPALAGPAGVGAGLGLLGLLAAAEGQRAEAGVDWPGFLGSSLVPAMAVQALPLALALPLAALAWSRAGRVRLASLGGAGALAVAALLGHSLVSHAPAARLPWLMVAAQFVHLLAFAVWIGGLAALLLALRGDPSPGKATAVRRFSVVAAGGLAAVALTGLVRAVDEVGAWSSLVSTLFGQLVLVKVGLLAVLAALGALNRFRHVPVVARSLGGLRRAGGAELGVVAGLLVASALLTSLAPPAYAPVAAAPRPQVSASGHDFGTTVRAALTVSPGHPGVNRFRLELVDFDSRKPVRADVVLRFAQPSNPDLGQSTLTLERQPDGTYRGRGGNLGVVGDWQVVAVVQRAESVEVPLRLAVRTPGGAPGAPV